MIAPQCFLRTAELQGTKGVRESKAPEENKHRDLLISIYSQTIVLPLIQTHPTEQLVA